VTSLDREHYEQSELWGAETVVLAADQAARAEGIQTLLPTDVASVVDVGAGDGRMLVHLARTRPELRVTALERSRSALAHVSGVPRIQGSIDQLPFPAGAFDAAICCEVLEHLPPPTLEAARTELARIAARYVVVTVPNRERRHRADVVCSACGCRYNRDRHLRSFSEADLMTLLPGFELAECVALGPRPPVYPRAVRTKLETLGLLPIPGSPTCPQCGEPHRPQRSSPHSAATSSQGDRYRRLRSLAPKQRRPYWLCALLRRSTLSR
jgi:SAM-dependent methyltransferase